MFSRPIAAALVVTGGLALAACGGDDRESLSDRGSGDQEREAALNSPSACVGMASTCPTRDSARTAPSCRARPR
jgi:hypothetical protein